MQVYLDNTATSYPKPEVVYKAINEFMRNIGASPGRGNYQKSIIASRMLYDCREALSRLFNVSNSENIIFTSNATEALNLALKGTLKKGEHIITSSLEHNAVMRPLSKLQNEREIEISIIPCDIYGHLNPKDVEKAICSNTKLIVMNHISNVIGSILPIAEIGEIAHKHNILFLIDAAQSAGVIPIDIKELKIDLLAFTGHKSLMGATGTGGLYIGENIKLDSLKEGGTGSRSESLEQPIFSPDKYEAGTLNSFGLAGLKAGVEFLLEIGVENVYKKEKELTKHFLIGLNNLIKQDKIKIYGPSNAEKQIGIISITAANWDISELGSILDRDYNIMVRTGLHCAPLAHKTIGTLEIGGTLRFGLGYFNTHNEIDYTLKALEECLR